MTLPVFDKQKHSVGIDGVGYIRDGSASIHRDDALPATARAAQGEGRYDSYQDDSYLAQADWSGGVGQGRFRAGDAILSGIGDGRRGGFFPAKKRLAATGNGGTTWEYFERLGVLYGETATQYEQINDGTNTVVSLTSGSQLCKPVVSASNNVLSVRSESSVQKIRRWDGTTITDVSIPGTTPYLVAPYNRFIWSFGTRTLYSTIQVPTVQKYEQGTAMATHRFVFTTKPLPALTSLLIVNWNGASTLTTPDGWTLDKTISNTVNTSIFRIDPSTSLSSVTLTFSGAVDCTAFLIQTKGLYDAAALDSDAQTATGTSANPTSASLTPINADTLVFVTFNRNQGGSVSYSAHTNSYTQLSEGTSSGTDHNAEVAYKILSASAATSTQATVTTSVDWASITIAYVKTTRTADITQTAVHYTLDDGSSWNEAFQDDTAGIPVPRAAVAAEGYLWLTTQRSLYRMAVDETASELNPLNPVLTVAFGEVDKWDMPLDTGVVGGQIAVSERVVYWGVGGTVRQYAPNGIGRPIWPPDDWATQAGAVQGIAAGEGGLYFGAGGYLYNYNGRGFHCLAKETNAGEFDYLKWHGGRLYLKKDPAAYYDFKYPSMRPDIVLTDATTFETGYAVTSLIDNEKTSIDKVIRRFQLQGYFTAGSTTAETGSLTLEYYAGTSLPDKLGGGATSLTWTNIGSLGGSDGAFYKDFTLGTPLVKKRYWLRVTLTPGSLGYPVLTGVVVDGRSLMPSVKRFIMPLRISTRVTDRQGNVMYPTPADVKAAFDALEALRPGTYYTLNYLDGPNSKVDYTVTSEQKLEQVDGYWHDASVSGLIQLVMKELP